MSCRHLIVLLAFSLLGLLDSVTTSSLMNRGNVAFRVHVDRVRNARGNDSEQRISNETHRGTSNTRPAKKSRKHNTPPGNSTATSIATATATATTATRRNSSRSIRRPSRFENDATDEIDQQFEWEQNKDIDNLAKLMELHQINAHDQGQLPNLQNLRSKSYEELQAKRSKPKWKKLVDTTVTVVEQSIDMMCPGSASSDLSKAVISKVVDKQTDNERVRSAEKRYNKLSSVCANMYLVSPTRSAQSRCFKAALVAGTSFQDAKDLDKKFEGLHIGSSKDVRTKANNDYYNILDGNLLVKKKQSLKRFDEAVLEKAVSFILSPDNCVSASWGTKTIKLSQNEIIREFPRLLRKKPRKMLYGDYTVFTDNKINDVKEKSFGRTAFYAIANQITSCDPIALKAVDYVKTVLINENNEILQDIIEKMLGRDHDKFKELENMIEKNGVFLKLMYSDFACKEDDNICFHGINYALSNPGDYDERNNIDCNACKFPSYLCHQLRTAVGQNPLNKPQGMLDEALQVISDAGDKFKYYMAHVCRVKCQQKATYDKIEQIRQICIETKGEVIIAYVIMDWKMKFEPLSSRESTQEHFGKRGIGWHGFLIIFFKYENGEAKRYNIYVDQVMAVPTKQDSPSVVGMIESVLATILKEKELNHIKQLVLQSDNAGCYQDNFVLLGIAHLNAKYLGKIFISEFIHTETQDGKSQLDGHFAQAISFLRWFVKVYIKNRITKIVTPAGLGRALSYNNGMDNCVVQLMKVNRECMVQMKKDFKPILDKLQPYFSRVNHVVFEEPEVQIEEYTHTILKGRFTVQAYSGIGRNVQFDFDIETNKVSIDEQGQNDAIEWLESLRDDEDNDNEDNEDEGSDSDESDDEDSDSDESDDEDYEYKEQDDDDFDVFDVNSDDSGDDSDTTSSDDISDDDDSLFDGFDEFEVDEEARIKQAKSSKNIRHYKAPTAKEYTDLKSVNIVKAKDLGEIVLMKKKSQDKFISSREAKPVENIAERKDAVSCAVRLALQKVTCEDSHFSDARKVDGKYDDAKDFVVEPFKGGWARRLRGESLYGPKYLKDFAAEIKSIFDEGNVTGNKKSPSEMRETLKEKFRDKFALPTESSIRQLISQLSQQEKNLKLSEVLDTIATSDDGDDDNTGRRRKTRWDLLDDFGDANDLLEEVVTKRANEKPNAMYDIWLEKVRNLYENRCLPHGIPDKESIKKRISALKSKIHKQAKYVAVNGPPRK